MSISATDLLSRQMRQLYGDYRDTRLNAKYYSHRLETIRRWNLGMEIVVAVTSSGSIAGWSVWQWSIGGDTQLEVGKFVWGSLGALTAVIAIMKPFLQHSKEIERYQGLASAYNALFFDLRCVVAEASVHRQLTPEALSLWSASKERLRELAPQDDPDGTVKKGLLRTMYDEVNQEIPAASLWMP